MIDVIGTDAGAPGSLPCALQALVQQADLVAAPQRMQPALDEWLEHPSPAKCMASDDPIALCHTLQSLPDHQRVVVLASGDPLWFGIGRALVSL